MQSLNVASHSTRLSVTTMSSVLPNTTRPATMMSKRFDPKDIPDLTGRVAIVTGGSKGIGFFDALELARKGAEVTIISANPENGHKAVADINQALRETNTLGSVEYIECNFDTLQDVDTAAKELAKKDERLDILICNAGIGQAPYKSTPDGLNAHFEVNTAIQDEVRLLIRESRSIISRIMCLLCVSWIV